MYETGVARPGAMAAILGDTTEPIEAICERVRRDPEGGVVVAANYNAPGQVVISGEVRGVEKAMTLAKAAGAKRAIALNVSGAFHSPLMEPARAGLGAALADVEFSGPVAPVCANVDARFVTNVEDGRALLVEQLTSPVRWTDVVLRLAASYPDALFVEMGPGSVLAGLVKKIAPAVQTMTCGTPAEVEQLMSRVS
jgi:[acyl-carrier-protein] S-malonyltransferase